MMAATGGKLDAEAIYRDLLKAVADGLAADAADGSDGSDASDASDASDGSDGSDASDAAAAGGERAGVLAIVGIHSGGAWVAERLHRDLGSTGPLGYLSSAFHRDDYAERGLRTGPSKGTQIDFDVEGADILLVDDILYTGRTVRAALNEIFDYGRPKRVRLAALLDRGGRELPVQPDYVGAALPLQTGQQFALERSADGRFDLSVEQA